jgi:formylglycine-generating enzyme required for sulfatase activity
LGANLLSILGLTGTLGAGDTVLIACGKYYLTSELIIPAGVVVQGGYNPDATTTLTRTYPGAEYPSGAPTFANMTILDGNAFFTSSRAKKHRVATVEGTLETCYIRGGHVNELSSGIPNKGGGLYVSGTVVSCIIRGNVANNITSRKIEAALGGGAYLTATGKIYNSLITNNMANDGYGVYGESGSTVTNVTIVYNTFAPVSILVPGTGPNIAEDPTNTANYYLHQEYALSESTAAAYDATVKVQLTDFYLGATETTCLQYCAFLAGIDYTVSSTVIVLANNYRDSLWTLKVYNSGITGEAGYKTVRKYYGTDTAAMSRTNDELYCTNNGYQLCGVDNISNDFGYLRIFDNIVVSKESTEAGTIPDDDISVCNVSWFGSLAYSQWLGGSLPTEAQWEFALRRKGSGAFQAPASGTAIANQSASLYNYAYAYDGYISGYVLTSVVPGYAWYSGNSNDTATASAYGVDAIHNHKIGEKKPNGLGLYDMNGNVWELCADFYRDVFYSLTDYVGSDSIAGNIVVNPVNNTVPGSSYSPPARITRGCGWSTDARSLRAGYRSTSLSSYYCSRNVGFRPAFLLPFAP